MEKIIKEADEKVEGIQGLLLDFRKFFYENPDVAERYKKFSKRKEEMIY